MVEGEKITEITTFVKDQVMSSIEDATQIGEQEGAKAALVKTSNLPW